MELLLVPCMLLASPLLFGAALHGCESLGGLIILVGGAGLLWILRGKGEQVGGEIGPSLQGVLSGMALLSFSAAQVTVSGH